MNAWLWQHNCVAIRVDIEEAEDGNRWQNMDKGGRPAGQFMYNRRMRPTWTSVAN